MTLWRAANRRPQLSPLLALGGLITLTFAGAIVAMWIRFSESTHATDPFVQSTAASGQGSALAWFTRVPERGNALFAVVSASEPVLLRAPEGWETVLDESMSRPPLAVFSRIASGRKGAMQFLAERSVPMTVQVYEYAGVDQQTPISWVRSTVATGIGLSGMASSAPGEWILGAYAVDPQTHGEVHGAIPRVWSRTYGGGSIALQAFERMESSETSEDEVKVVFSREATGRLALIGIRQSGTSVRSASGEDLPLELTLTASDAHSSAGVASTFHVAVSNPGPSPVTDLLIETPGGLWRFADATVHEGTFFPFARHWRIPTLDVGATAVLDLELVQDEALPGTSMLVSVRVMSYAQAASLEGLPEAHAMLEFQGTPVEAAICPTIDDVSLSVDVSSGHILAEAQATGAAYALVGPTVNRADAVFAQPGEAIKIPFDATRPTTRVYAWLGNGCRVSFVVTKDVETPAQGTSEEIPRVDPLCKPPFAAVSRLLVLDDEGPDVDALHRLLICLGYLDGDRVALFTPQTQDAVRAFQRDNGLSAVGYVGPATRVLLNAYRETLKGALP